MFNRIAKQSLGLGDCYSNNLEVQYNHVAAVSLVYALAQQEMKRGCYKIPEDAIRALKGKFDSPTFYQFIEQDSFSPHFMPSWQSPVKS